MRENAETCDGCYLTPHRHQRYPHIHPQPPTTATLWLILPLTCRAYPPKSYPPTPSYPIFLSSLPLLLGWQRPLSQPEPIDHQPPLRSAALHSPGVDFELVPLLLLLLPGCMPSMHHRRRRWMRTGDCPSHPKKQAVFFCSCPCRHWRRPFFTSSKDETG